MARSAQRRNRQERRPTPRARTAPAARRPQSYEDTMFFPRLRRQTKWMFVFLAIIFGLGYVIFNVGGSIPGTGLGDVLQGIGQSTSSGPSEGDARDKIKDHPENPAGYLELATALQRNGKTDEAIEPLTRYLGFRPKDRAALSQLAGLYLTQGKTAQEQAAQAQAELTQITGGGVFAPDSSTKLGQQLGEGKITQIESAGANQRLSQAYLAYQDAYQNATRTYQQLVAAIPKQQQAEQPSIFLQLAFAAQSANQLQDAINAYKRFLLVAPDSPNEAGVREQIKQLEAALKAQPKQG
jgi:tetratricopeptide (TPR) repeat protein